MAPRAALYDRLARLLDYPEADWAGELARTVEPVRRRYEAAGEALAVLARRLAPLPLAEIQELYTRTFDINPVCTLEVGWHIYGEDYARGALLVLMRRRLREMNLPESRELPDHLTHALALLGRLGGDDADELAARYVLPALAKMLSGMDGEEHPHRALLVAVNHAVRADHPVEPAAPRGPRTDPPGWGERLPVCGAPAGRRADCGGGEGRS